MNKISQEILKEFREKFIVDGEELERLTEMENTIKGYQGGFYRKNVQKEVEAFLESAITRTREETFEEISQMVYERTGGTLKLTLENLKTSKPEGDK